MPATAIRNEQRQRKYTCNSISFFVHRGGIEDGDDDDEGGGGGGG